MTLQARTTCRVCGSTELIPLFSLGEQAVSDFVKYEEVDCGKIYPIDIQMCRMCTLVQSAYTAPQELLYTLKYWYKSGVTDTMRSALREISHEAEQFLQPGDVALDIGSNDGTLLRSYTRGSCTTVGVEPATNLTEEGSVGVDHLIADFWSADKYLSKVGKKAEVITAIGMFYDLDDPNQFINDIARSLQPDGTFIAQLMCMRQTIESADVGNFAHEHLEFYTLRSLDVLFGRHGLELYDLKENSVNGGSYRLFVSHTGQRRISPELKKAREYERKHVTTITACRRFFERIEKNKAACLSFIKGEVARGKTVWVYGASTKGNVILQYYGLKRPEITAASDRSPPKHGLYTIASGIPIYSEEIARESDPDYFLVLPYAFLPEFMERESAWRARGGKFIVPLPEFRVV